MDDTTALPQPEETLDPADWAALRALGHRMVDDILGYLETVRERPVWRPLPERVQQAFDQPLPLDEQPAEDTYAAFCQDILPYSMGNVHPRFWGWVMGNNTPLTVLAEMLAAGMNPNMGGGEHASAHVESQVIDWCKDMLGYPRQASGLLVSGGSMANLIGLAVARNARASFDVRQDGMAASPQPLTLYGSVEMHSSLQRAVELLGLGDRALRRIPVGDDGRIDVAALEQAIQADLAHGCRPICLIGNAGTVNTGAIDPLDELADAAARYGLWFHVDGAFGALAYLAPELRSRLRGMERADSLAFDLHKWVYLPFEAGCILVRDAEAHRRTFAVNPDYLHHESRGVGGGTTWYGDLGLQLTRSFRALKVWMALKTYGVRKLGRVIAQNVAQAAYLAQRIESSPCLELAAPLALNIVCFRFIAPGLDTDGLNALNHELLLRLHESGLAVPSGTMLGERYVLRCAITNHRSRREDFDLLVEAVEHLGEELMAEGLPEEEAYRG